MSMLSFDLTLNFLCSEKSNKANDEKDHQCQHGGALRTGDLCQESEAEHAYDDGNLFSHIKKAEEGGGIFCVRHQFAVCASAQALYSSHHKTYSNCEVVKRVLVAFWHHVACVTN